MKTPHETGMKGLIIKLQLYSQDIPIFLHNMFKKFSTIHNDFVNY